MINKYIDHSFIMVGFIYLMGIIYLTANVLLSFASVVLDGAPELLRYIIVYSVNFIIAMGGLWKLSEIWGSRLEDNNEFNLKQQIIATCIGAILDPILLFILQIIPTVGKIAFRLHFYGAFPGELFKMYGGIDFNSAVFIGVMIDIPIVIAVRCVGLIHGKNSITKHRAYVQELAKTNSQLRSNASSGRSWRDSVGNSTANRADYLKNQNKNN